MMSLQVTSQDFLSCGMVFVCFWDCNKMQMYISCICDYDRNWEVLFVSICDVGGSSSQSKSFTETKRLNRPYVQLFLNAAKPQQ